MRQTKISALIENLKAQKEDPRAPNFADPKYLDDHIAIAERALEWTRKGVLRMEKIVDALKNKRT